MSINETELSAKAETEFRKRKSSPDVLMTGMYMLLIILAYELFSFVASIILTVPDYYEKYQTNAMFYNIVGIVFELCFVGLPLLAMLLLYNGNRKELLRLNTVSFKEIVILIVIGFLTFLSNLFLTDANCLLAELFLDVKLPEVPPVKNTAEAIVEMVMLIIVAPVLEEFMTRGVMMRGFEGASKGFAIVISGVFFGMLHMSYYTLIPKVLAGILFCYVVYITDSVYSGIILHAINNGITGLITVGSELGYFGEAAEETAQETLTTAEQIYQIIIFFVIGLSLAVVIAGMTVVLKRAASKKNESGKLVPAGKVREKFSNEKKFRWFWVIPIILTFGYFVAMMLREIMASLK